ncbi:unnamed protein product [Nippostrongylus brasiliensis]|uniref:ZP domain-containing protein n=1 Tax=Nippostrongylus brasiliensis TaxID=27835 RepID=A0A0N4YFY5_NIPBR|nr:unnamed protein product [Nippostrongylus brasiliensis]
MYCLLFISTFTSDRQKYSGELVKDKDEQYHVTKPPSDDAAFEPSIGRGSELVPLEDSIDPQYPAQRIVITSFVRNGCHIKRWLYEDSYPIGGVRPAIADLVCSGPRDMSVSVRFLYIMNLN